MAAIVARPVGFIASVFQNASPKSSRVRFTIAANCRLKPQAPTKQASIDQSDLNAAIIGTACLCLPLLAPEAAHAVGGQFGPLFEGRAVSLIHPGLMFFLLGATSYSGYLGLKVRRARKIPEQLKELKAQLPAADAEGNRPSSPAESQLSELDQERKALLKEKNGEKHFQWGSLLLGLGVAIAVAGPVNTYLRTGKLFPGPHLYAGAGITVLWAAAASLTPAMNRGSESARNAHIALNSINLGLFLWQVPTGLEIVGKVFEFTTWP